MRDCVQKDSVNAIASVYPHASHYCLKLPNVFISATYTQSTANTASNHFINLPFKGCKQRVDTLPKCRRYFHHRGKYFLTELCIKI